MGIIKREIYPCSSFICRGFDLLEVYLMWSFPIVSVALSFFFWKGEFSKKELVILAIGLCLQALAYHIGPVGPFLSGAPWISLGKGLLLGIVWANFGLKVQKIPEKNRESIRYKFILFCGLLFLTLTNQFGSRLSDAVLTCAFILLPAVYWSTRSQKELKITFALFSIGFLAFFSFFLTWTGVMRDLFQANPLLWMIAFSSCFFISFRSKENA